jgi:uncharacterized protein (TIRG00374 family)
MDVNAKKVFKTLNPNKIWVPVIFGVGIVIILFFTDKRITVEKLALVFEANALPILLAVLVFLSRFAGYLYRIRVITDNSMGWKGSFFVIILWEFASAVTPSVVGGTAVAVFILWKEGINLGKSLAFVLLTAIFDNLFFVVAAPIFILLAPHDVFPNENMEQAWLEQGVTAVFWTSYTLIALYTSFMAFAVFINPRWVKWLLIKITSLNFLRRWRYAAYERGNELIVAAENIKGKSRAYWIKIALSTIFIWSSRYLLLNCLIAAFTTVSPFQHVLIFGKQIILWVIMLISPTPGSSGTAEIFFNIFFGASLGDYTFITNILWRIFTYYPYLLLGAVFLPRWIKRIFVVNKPVEDASA